MAGRSAKELVDIKLVEERRIEESYFQDYAKIHERLDRTLEKAPRPLPVEEGDRAAESLLAWLYTQAEKNVPVERLTQFLRCGLGHICAEMTWVQNSPPELGAARAYDELKRRGWSEAVFDPALAAEAAKNAAPPEKPTARKAVVKNTNGKGTMSGSAAVGSSSEKEARRMSNIEETGVAPVAAVSAEKKAEAPKKPVAKKPAVKKAVVAKKPVAKKPAAKPVAKKPAAKPVAKKPVAKKPAAKPVAKKPVAKKPMAKKPVAKKPAAKPVAKKPVAKKPAAKPAVKKPAAK